MENALWNSHVGFQGEEAAWTGPTLHSQPHPPSVCLPSSIHLLTIYLSFILQIINETVLKFYHFSSSLSSIQPLSGNCPLSSPKFMASFPSMCMCKMCVCSQVHEYNLLKLHVSCMRVITCYWTTEYFSTISLISIFSSCLQFFV